MERSNPSKLERMNILLKLFTLKLKTKITMGNTDLHLLGFF